MSFLSTRRTALSGLMALMFVLVSQAVLGEEVKIVKVLDANLFQLQDGRRTRLANVQTPSRTDTNGRVRALAYRIQKYAEQQLLRKRVTILYDSSTAKADPLPVHLFQKFPLKRAWYNKIYLERGYGKYVEEGDTTYRAIYRKAEARARRKERGVWNPNLYAPGFPRNYAIQLLVGWGQEAFRTSGDYREIHFLFAPLQPTRNFSGFRIHWGAFITRHYWGHGSPPETGIEVWGLEARAILNGKFVGVEPGLIWIHIEDEDYDRPVIWPSSRLKVGLVNRVYLTFDFLTDLLHAPRALGIAFLNRQPYLKLWVGYAKAEDARGGEILSFEGKFLPYRRILITIHARQFNPYYTSENLYALRMGVGYVIR
ncbi:MAG: hypothetical protein D6681_12440 [Calditrichaeota bacterium]|nr:MAG: hypothetical protein D6681_12440 [Calditrichota bacterium]